MTIASGARILVTDILALPGPAPIWALSTSATTYTSNTSFGNVTGLSAAVAANQKYRLRGRIIVTGANATHDVKAQFSLPAAATINWSMYGQGTGLTNAIGSWDQGPSTGVHIRGTFAGTLTYPIDGLITTLGTAGTVQFQAAQNTSDPGALSIDAGSYFELQLLV